jgi:hypothetical protein
MNHDLFFFHKMFLRTEQAHPLSAGLIKPAQERKIMDLISGSHSVGQNLYHLEWCPKYRYNMFRREDHKNLCEKILHEVAQRHHIVITES